MVTCGFSKRHSNMAVDRFLKVYDIRMLRALAPIQVSIDPMILRFLPSFSSRIATVSPGGQMEILETQALSQTNFCLYQVKNFTSISIVRPDRLRFLLRLIQVTTAPMCLSFDVSSSCHQMAFGDSNGTLHLFSSNPSSMFNSFSRDTEFPDPVDPLNLAPINIMDEMASYSTIPIFFTNNNSSLASDWPKEYATPTYRKAPTIDPSILQSMKMVGPIGYAPNPGTFRRNQMQYINTQDNNGMEQNHSNSNGINIINNNKHHLDSHQDGSPTHWSNNNGHHRGGSPMNHSAFPPLQFNGSPNHHHPTGSPVHIKHHHAHHPHPHRPPHHHAFPPGPAGHHPPPHQFQPGPPPPPFFYSGPHPGPQQPPMMPPGTGGPPVRPFFHKSNPTYAKNNFYPGKRSGFHGSRYQIPKRYTKYEWKKHFFEESDMDSFNRTKFSGNFLVRVNYIHCFHYLYESFEIF